MGTTFGSLVDPACDWVTVVQGTETQNLAYWPTDGLGGTTNTAASSKNFGASSVTIIGILCHKITAGDIVAVVTADATVYKRLSFTILAGDRFIPINVNAKDANIALQYTSATASNSYTLLYKRNA